MRPLALAVLALSLAACDSTGPAWPTAGSEVDASAAVAVEGAEAIAAARAAWEAARPAAYRIRYEVVCFCPPTTVDALVVDGQVAELRVDGEPPLGPFITPGTLEGFFEEAAFAVERGADAVDLRVLPGAGSLPVSLGIDWAFEAADDETGYVVRAYSPTAGPID